MTSASPGPTTVLRGHASDVQALALLSDRLLYSGDAEGMVHLWDMEERRSVFKQVLHGLPSGILSLQLIDTPGSGKLLISGGRDGTIKGWQVYAGGALSSSPTFCTVTGSYNFCRPHAAVAAPTTNAAVAAPTTNAAVAAPTTTDGASCAHAPTPQMTATSASSANTQASHGCSRASTPASVCDSGCLVAGAVAEDGAVCVWDVQSEGREVLRLKRVPPAARPGSSPAPVGGSGLGNSRGMCMAVRLIPGPSSTDWRVLSGYEDGSVCLWDLRRPNQPIAVGCVHMEPLLCLAASEIMATGTQQGHRISAVSGATDCSVACYSVVNEDGKLDLRAAVKLELQSPGVSDCAIRGDGRVFALACWDGKVRVHSTKLKRGCPALALLQYHTKEVTCLCFAPTPSASGAQQQQQQQSSRKGGNRGGELGEGSQRCVQDACECEQGEGLQGRECWYDAGQGVELESQNVEEGSLSAGRGTLVTASRDGSIAVWHLFPP